MIEGTNRQGLWRCVQVEKLQHEAVEVRLCRDNLGGAPTCQANVILGRRAASALLEQLAKCLGTRTCSCAECPKDDRTGLQLLGEQALEVNRSNGWEVLEPAAWSSPHRLPTVLALIHSEVSEALEAFRKNDHRAFQEELADVLLRVLDCSAGLGIDLGQVALKKLEHNKTRGFRHGGKRV